MKNNFRRTKVEHSDLFENEVIYNSSILTIISDLLIGMIVGVGICFGFIFAFFMLGGSLLFSLFVFIFILLLSASLALILKFIVLVIILKKKEIELLHRILHKR